jgi:hypothetical protein
MAATDFTVIDLRNLMEASACMRSMRAQTSSGQLRIRELLRVVLSRWGFLPHGPSLPVIDSNSSAEHDVQGMHIRQRQFYRLLWDELFQEPFVRMADTNALRERIDSVFVNAPGQPERWGPLQYRNLSRRAVSTAPTTTR